MVEEKEGERAEEERGRERGGVREGESDERERRGREGGGGKGREILSVLKALILSNRSDKCKTASV